MTTSTENTKWIDEAFKFDLGKNTNLKFKTTKFQFKAFCNKCGSDDCQIFKEIEEVK
jgi:hypothetical protein